MSGAGLIRGDATETLTMGFFEGFDYNTYHRPLGISAGAYYAT